MCWNADISINTFIFSLGALLFIYLTNTFTKYKTVFFKNPLTYFFILSVSSMQLIEFFLWRNLKNKQINTLLSVCAFLVIVMQQIIFIMLIPNVRFRYSIFSLWILLGIFLIIYKIKTNSIDFSTSIGINGHLSWNWANFKGYDNIWVFIGLLFYIIPSILITNDVLILSSTMFILFSSLYFYFKSNTFGTMWCWILNFGLLYFIIDILLIQPYYEYNGLC